MSLTASEMSTLRKLRDKMKSHELLSEIEIDEMEKCASDVIERFIGPYPEFLKVVAKFQELLCILARDNIRLIADVRSLNEEMNGSKESGISEETPF